MNSNFTRFIAAISLTFCLTIASNATGPKIDLPLSLSTFKELIDATYTGMVSYIEDAEAKMILDKGGKSTYGEIYAESLKTILDDQALTKEDRWIDMGSGNGKTCLQVGTMTDAEAWGIELSPTRYKNAVKALKYLKKERGIKLGKKVKFFEQNILDADFSKGTIFYMCSTCYPDSLMQAITDKIAKLKDGTRLLTLKDIPAHPNLKLVKTYNLPMTWTSGTAVYSYVVEKATKESKPKKNNKSKIGSN